MVVFILLHITPADPAVVMLGDMATPEQVANLRTALGLDAPLYVQYWRYLTSAVRGDFGLSIRARRSVATVVWERVPATAELSVAALGLALAVGLPLGVAAAIRRGTVTDLSVLLFSLVGQSMPAYWLGLMLIVVFSVQLHWLPGSGRGGVVHLVLPAVTLASFLVGLITRLARAELLDTLREDYVRTARAKGIGEVRVLWRHAYRNALLPIVTVVGLQIGTLLGGAVITEAVFAWPGIGSLAVVALFQRDYPVVQGVVLVAAVGFVAVNLVIDLVYQWLDPRIAYG